jgi:hypothetical protein
MKRTNFLKLLVTLPFFPLAAQAKAAEVMTKPQALHIKLFHNEEMLSHVWIAPKYVKRPDILRKAIHTAKQEAYLKQPNIPSIEECFEFSLEDFEETA